MKFYSEKLKTLFDTTEELEKAEEALTKKEAEKTILANKIKKSINIIAKEMNMILDTLAIDIDWTTAEEESIITELMNKFVPLLTKIRMM